MKLKNCLMIGATVLSMGVGISTGASTANANSLPKPDSRYWINYHKVYVKKSVKAYHIHLVFPEYKSKAIGSRTLKRGTKIYTRYNGLSWAWIVKGNGMKNTSRYFWTVDRVSTSWIYQK